MHTFTAAELPITISQPNRILRRLILVYFLILCVIAPFNLLAFDSYYYWDWSRHLDLSYYDGPPLIAYIIRLMTLFSGPSVCGLAFISILFTALTARVLYKTASLFLEEKACYLATLFWLTSPLVTQDLLIQVTYDTPMTFFWACSLYYAVSYVKTNHTKTLYCLGASLGFLLLSKYTGIVLVIGLLTFILFTPYIRLLKNPHCYGAIFLIILIFSPVLLWNEQHHWISFGYQLHTHRTQSQNQGLLLLVHTIGLKILPALNLMILPPFLALKQRKVYAFHDNIRLLIVISLSFLGFYLLLSTVVNFRNTWLMQYLLTSALIMGWLTQCFFVKQTADKKQNLQRIKKTIYGFISLNMLISLGFLLNTCLHFVPSKNFISYTLIQQFNVDYSEQPATVFTSGWLEARLLFFLKTKPLIYTLDCGQDQNAYQLWSQPIKQKIQQGGLKSVLFVDMLDRQSCLQRYFERCERRPTASVSGKSLYVYHCTEPRSS